MFKKLLALSIFILWLSSFGTVFAGDSAVFTLVIKFNDALQSFMGGKTFSHLHFDFGGNNFWGLIYSDGVKPVSNFNLDLQKNIGEEIVRNGKTIHCYDQLKGLYYNSQRGERLWPLDEDTRNIPMFHDGFSGLTMTWGIYTHCESDEVEIDSNSFFGYLTHNYDNHDYGLIAGVQYDATGNVITWETFANNLQTFNQQYNLGLIYDFNGWIAGFGISFNTWGENFVTQTNTHPSNNFFHNNDGSFTWEYGDPNGDALTGEVVFAGRYCKKMEEYFGPTTGATLCNLLNSGFNNHTWTWININAGSFIDQMLLLKIQGIIGMSTDVADDVKNIAGNEKDSKTQYFSSVNVNNATLINAAKKESEKLCQGKWSTTLTNSDVICIDRSKEINDIQNYDGKTIILRNGILTLKGNSRNLNNGINVFVDRGNLKFAFDGDKRQTFNERWFPTANSTDAIYSGIYLKGNFIVNGLVEVEEEKDYKYFIHGKFTSLNTYSAASSSYERLHQIQNLLSGVVPEIGGTDVGNLVSKADLTQVFRWRCNYWHSTDESNCNTGDFANSPLNIINQTVPSLFF